MNKLLKLLIFAISLSSCAGVNHTGRDYRYMPINEPETIERSLFSNAESTISEDDIRRLLEGRIIIKDSLRIAIFNYSSFSKSKDYSRSWYRTDEDFLKTQQSYIETLSNNLSESKKVKRIILMPSIMANENSSITNLRETAVRLQADFLLVYAIKSDIYYRYRTFSNDEAKAFATIETFLMDTRTGVIPFTTIATEEHLLRKTSPEITIDELRKNTEKMAVIKALNVVGTKVFEFLNDN